MNKKITINKKCPNCGQYKTTSQVILGMSLGLLGASCSACLILIPIVLLITLPVMLIGGVTVIYNLLMRVTGNKIGYYCMNCNHQWRE